MSQAPKTHEGNLLNKSTYVYLLHFLSKYVYWRAIGRPHSVGDIGLGYVLEYTWSPPPSGRAPWGDTYVNIVITKGHFSF